MPHPSHKLKAYMAEPNKPMVFCEACGTEEDEPAIHDTCNEKFLHQEIKQIVDRYQARAYKSKH